MGFQWYEFTAEGNFRPCHALLNRASDDHEKVSPVRNGEPSISFGQIRGDGNACPV